MLPQRSLCFTQQRCSTIHFPAAGSKLRGLSRLLLSEETLKVLELKHLILQTVRAWTRHQQRETRLSVEV